MNPAICGVSHVASQHKGAGRPHTGQRIAKHITRRIFHAITLLCYDNIINRVNDNIHVINEKKRSLLEGCRGAIFFCAPHNLSLTNPSGYTII
jgi:hypothetical protein